MLFEIFCLTAINYPGELIQVDTAILFEHLHVTSIVHVVVENLFAVAAQLYNGFSETLIFVVILVADQAKLQ